jgi:hypothetical protein
MKLKMPDLDDDVFEIKGTSTTSWPAMAARIRRDEYISGEELAYALKHAYYDKREMPKEVLQYYFLFLLGNIKKVKGRKGVKGLTRIVSNFSERDAVSLYRECLKGIQEKQKVHGVLKRKGSTKKNQSDLASIQAAEVVIKKYFKDRNISAEYFIRNIVPKHSSR